MQLPGRESVLLPGSQSEFVITNQHLRFRGKSRQTGKTAAMNLHNFFAFRDSKIAYYRGSEDTAQTAAVLKD